MDEDYERAEQHALRLRDAAERLGPKGSIVLDQFLNLAVTALGRGDLDAARSRLAEAIERHAELGEARNASELLWALAVLAAMEGAAGVAIRYWAAAQNELDKLGAAMSPSIRPLFERHVRPLRESVPEGEFAAEWDAGARLGSEVALARAVDEQVAAAA